MDQSNKHNKTPWIIAAVSVTILLVVVFLFRTAIYGEFNNLKLTPEPETFTELYFNDPGNLPKDIVKGQTAKFSFTVHNEEGVQTKYPYVVYFADQDGKQTDLAEGSVTLDSDAQIAINVSHTFAATQSTGMVVVSLTSLNQSIDFLIPNTN